MISAERSDGARTLIGSSQTDARLLALRPTYPNSRPGFPPPLCQEV